MIIDFSPSHPLSLVAQQHNQINLSWRTLITHFSHLFTGSNYNTWSRAMLMALNANNKLRFVDGTLSQPITDDPTAEIWSRCNNMVTSWLLNAVSKEIVDSLLYLESAHAVWANLHERFHQSKLHEFSKSSNNYMISHKARLMLTPIILD